GKDVAVRMEADSRHVPVDGSIADGAIADGELLDSFGRQILFEADRFDSHLERVVQDELQILECPSHALFLLQRLDPSLAAFGITVKSDQVVLPLVKRVPEAGAGDPERLAIRIELVDSAKAGSRRKSRQIPGDLRHGCTYPVTRWIAPGNEHGMPTTESLLHGDR